MCKGTHFYAYKGVNHYNFVYDEQIFYEKETVFGKSIIFPLKTKKSPNRLAVRTFFHNFAIDNY